MGDKIFHSGVVAVIGRPNAGKSSLLNRILDYKLSIVSAKPQTTRDNILGLYNSEQAQIIFVDTPGIHRPVNKLGEKLVERAVSELEEADVVLFVITIDDRPTQKENARIIELLKSCRDIPVLLAVNKIDMPGSRGKILSVIDSFTKSLPLKDAVPVSAKDGT
nr:GTPase Era [Schwartzia sp. (in: firmicutes)]